MGGRIKAERLIAHGFECERCDLIQEVRNESSNPPPGYHFPPRAFRRITEQNKVWSNPKDIWLCSKECFIEFVQYGISHATERED